MRIKTLAIAAIALFGLCRTGVGRSRDPDRVGLGSRAARPARRSSRPTRRRSTTRSTSSTRPTAATPASKTSRTAPASSPARPAPRSPAMPARPTSSSYLDGLCMDVNPQNKLSNITIQQTHDIYRGLLTNWSRSRARPDHDDRPGRPRHQRRDLQLLPPGGSQQRTAVLQRQRADRRRPRRQRGQAGPERDRLRRARLAGQGPSRR